MERLKIKIWVMLTLLLISTALVANALTDASVGMMSFDREARNFETKSSSVDWWPMFRHDLTHTGYSTSTAPNTNNTIWSYTTGNDVFSSPAVADGRVYVGSYDRKVYCLDALTGSYVWSYTTGDWVGSSPAVAGGRVYVGSRDNKVYCLDADTGAFIWNYTTGWYVFSSPAVADGRVYVGSWDRKVYCLDALTGSYIWSYTTGNWVGSSPAVADGRVYVGSNDRKVYCLDAATGAFIWSYTTGAVVSSSPAVVDGRVYVGSYDNKVYCLDALTGSYVWSYTTGDWVDDSSPAVAGGRVYVGSVDNKVYCLDTLTGSYIWSYTTGNDVFSSPAVADGRVYVGSYDNKVYALNALTGALVWSYTTGYYVFSSPAVADGRVYVGSEDGKVYAFGPSQLIHDVAITNVTPSKTVVGQGYSMNVNVTVANQGDFTETFNVTLYAQNQNQTAINETGLVGYWKFDEGTGTTAYDSSGNNNHGELTNGPTWVDGKYGKALRFDGIDDYVEIPDSPELRLNESKGLTIMLWFYRTSYPQYDNVLVSKQVYPGWVEYQLDLINTGNLEFKTWDGYNNAVIGSTSVPDANKWYHVAYVMNNTHWDFYVNGTLENSGTTSYDLYISNSNLTIGQDIGAATFNGIIDEVKVHDRTLSAGEIWAEYTRTGLGSRFALQTQTVTLESGASTTITFTWNTTGFAKGNYTISAYAWPVPGETETTNNNFTNGTILVTFPGDVNGDRKVRIDDVLAVATAFGSNRGDPKYQENLDITNDAKIRIDDVLIAALNFGRGPW